MPAYTDVMDLSLQSSRRKNWMKLYKGSSFHRVRPRCFELLPLLTILFCGVTPHGITADSTISDSNKLSLNAGKKRAHGKKSELPVSHKHGSGAVSTSRAVVESGQQSQAYLTVNQVIANYGNSARQMWTEQMKSVDKKMVYPPRSLVWICLKEEKQLFVFGRDTLGQYRCLKKYPIVGASGKAGPKLKEGDKQVPEGFYKIVGFRPNVIAHLGLAVNYPNVEDRTHAKSEGRSNLGGDILIHGSRWSTGCLAMGNEPIEELFVLAHDVGIGNIELIFAPCNLLKKEPNFDWERKEDEPPLGEVAHVKPEKPIPRNKTKQPVWAPALYDRLRAKLKAFSLELN